MIVLDGPNAPFFVLHHGDDGRYVNLCEPTHGPTQRQTVASRIPDELAEHADELLAQANAALEELYELTSAYPHPREEPLRMARFSLPSRPVQMGLDDLLNGQGALL